MAFRSRSERQELEWAMDRGIGLAVGVSHLQIQHTAGVLSERTWKRLQDHDRIGEIHIWGPTHQDGIPFGPLQASDYVDREAAANAASCLPGLL